MSDRRRPHILDIVAVGVFALAVVFVLTGLLPWDAAAAVMERILPLLLFLATVIILAELTAAAEVFNVIAAQIARIGAGSYAKLFLLCVLFASVTTATLNLDTTAVLLTPIMLALARKASIAAIPLAMTTVWLANTASLLLPVSNLTNLLAMDRINLEPAAFAARMWPLQLVSMAVTMVFLWLFYWRRSARKVDRYDPPPAHVPSDRVLFLVAGIACVVFVSAILIVDAELWIASGVCAALVVVAFAFRRRGELKVGLIPFRLLIFVTGLFLVVETFSRRGLSDVMHTLIGVDGGVPGLFRAAGTGAGLSNVVNNLPAYVAGEAVIPPPNQEQLLALLVGTNIGPIITPWASLATLLWYERCHAFGVDVPMRRFMATGAVLAVAGLLAVVSTLALTA